MEERSVGLDRLRTVQSTRSGNSDAGATTGASVPGALAVPATSKLPLSRRYASVLATYALPLVLLVAGLGLYQFYAQREAQLAAIASDMSEAKLVVDSVVRTALDHAEQLRAHATDLLKKNLAPSDSELRRKLKPSSPLGGGQADGMTLDGIAGTALESQLGNTFLVEARLGAAVDGEVDMALALFETMRLDHLVTPYLRWSYYFSASGAFVTIFPFVRRTDLVDGFGHPSLKALIDAYLGYEIFVGATPARIPTGCPSGLHPISTRPARAGWSRMLCPSTWTTGLSACWAPIFCCPLWITA
jgi:hypothetical protein